MYCKSVAMNCNFLFQNLKAQIQQRISILDSHSAVAQLNIGKRMFSALKVERFSSTIALPKQDAHAYHKILHSKTYSLNNKIIDDLNHNLHHKNVINVAQRTHLGPKTTKFPIYVNIFGILFIISGVKFFDDFPDFTDDSYALNFQVIPIVTIILGCIILMVSCIGLGAVIRKNDHGTLLYSYLMVVLVILQIALFIWTAVNVSRSSLLKFLLHKVYFSWWWLNNHHYRHFIQKKLKCCGIFDPNEYHLEHIVTPFSCCGSVVDVECEPSIYLKRPACIVELLAFWRKNVNNFRNYNICIMVIEFIAVILAWILIIRNKRGIQN